MKRIGISAYSVSLHHSKFGKINLNDIINGKNILQLIFECFGIDGNNFIDDSAQEKLYRFSDYKIEEIEINGRIEYRILYGCLKTGEYGIESELVDVSDHSIVSKKTTQADVLPFGFCIALAEGNIDKVIILSQTLGVLGIKSILHKYINQCVDYYSLDYNVIWGNLLPIGYIQKLLKKGTLKKIRMIKNEIPNEKIERMGINNGVMIKEERIFHNPTGFLDNNMSKIKEWLSGQRSYTNIIEIEDFDYDVLKFEFKLGNSNKTLNFADTTTLRINEDITEKVELKGGVPVFSSLIIYIKEIAEDYLKAIGYIIE